MRAMLGRSRGGITVAMCSVSASGGGIGIVLRRTAVKKRVVSFTEITTINVYAERWKYVNPGKSLRI